MVQLAARLPAGLHGLLRMYEHWTYSVFFCVAELWGAIVISVLSWTLANELCTVSEAKTVYPLVGIAANFALVLAGNVMKFVNRGIAKVASWIPLPDLHNLGLEYVFMCERDEFHYSWHRQGVQPPGHGLRCWGHVLELCMPFTWQL